ncbi:peptidase M23B [Arthrobacter crystallopoietes BAB-32]|uniref:Peptidase M23B n=2 Tax=Crystallibacter crystallopoietes TaxID=37928 RepID=N1V2V6_9MICC|nr:peptidase M23B [Arthrobacter crystallopoietes BAB-32]
MLTAAAPSVAAGPKSPQPNPERLLAAPAVTAPADVALPFDRAGVTSLPPKEETRKKIKTAAANVAIEAAVTEINQASEPSPTQQQAPAKSGAKPEGSIVLAAPLASMQMTSPFGHRVSPLTGKAGELHTGTDFADRCGTPVFASAAGTVVEAGWHSGGGGNRLVIDHGNGVETTYNHLANFNVRVGEQVAEGGRIATVGTTGASTGCHLHFEVMLHGKATDPAGWLAF